MSIEGELVTRYRADSNLSALVPDISVGERPSPQVPYCVLKRGAVVRKTDTSDGRLEDVALEFVVVAEFEDVVKRALRMLRLAFHRTDFTFTGGRCYALLENSGATELVTSDKGLWTGRLPFLARIYTDHAAGLVV